MPDLKPVASRALVVRSFVRIRQILLAGSIAAPGAEETRASRVHVLNHLVSAEVRLRNYTLNYGIAFVTAAARRLKATFSVLYTLPQSLLVEGEAND